MEPSILTEAFIGAALAATLAYAVNTQPTRPVHRSVSEAVQGLQDDGIRVAGYAGWEP